MEKLQMPDVLRRLMNVKAALGLKMMSVTQAHDLTRDITAEKLKELRQVVKCPHIIKFLERLDNKLDGK